MIVQDTLTSKSEVRVAGTDLVLRKSGICLLRGTCLDAFLIDGSDLRGLERLVFIRDELAQRVITWQPDIIVLEGPAYEADYQVFAMGECSSILKILAWDAGIPLLVVPPKQLKFFVTGSGSASKKRMMRDVAKHYGYRTEDDNEADAVGLAKLGEVYLTGRSKRRCELELIHRLKSPKPKSKKKFKNERIHV